MMMMMMIIRGGRGREENKKIRRSSAAYIPSILVVKSTATERGPLGPFQRNIQMPSNKLMISKNYDNF
jgi:hypothetical protein